MTVAIGHPKRGPRSPPPVRVTIKHMTVDRVDLYRHIPLPGRPIPVVITPFPVEEYLPGNEDISWAVCRICLNRSRGLSGLQEEHLRTWLGEAT